MRRQKVLAIAAGTRRVGYVFLIGKRLRYWQLSDTASYSPEDAARYAKKWIDEMRPDVVVTEKLTKSCRKSHRTRALIEAVAHVSANEHLFDVSVVRPRQFPNKYVEADAFAKRFPELRRFVPKPRRLWDPEPRNTMIFEALALALEVIDREG